jgi:hypothetical protein
VIHALIEPEDQNEVPIRSAVYDAATHTVTLRPMKRLSLQLPYTLTVNGTSPSGLRDDSWTARGPVAPAATT